MPDTDLRMPPRSRVRHSSRAGPRLTVKLVGGQDVLTVPTIQAKQAAQLHGLGGGFLPEPMARPYIEAGHLVERQTERVLPIATRHCAWRVRSAGSPGRAMQWWLERFDNEGTRRALLERHRGR